MVAGSIPAQSNSFNINTHIPRMANSVDATTPQLKAVKSFIDAYLTLDLKNVEPLVSSDFQFQTYPKIADHPDQEKGAHFEKYGSLYALLTKVEVRFQR